MSSSTSKFARYRQALAAISTRTGTPLPSLILSFGIVHEITAIVPVVGIFYGAKSLGIGERVVSAVIDENQQHTGGDENYSWAQQKMRTWVEEGDRWAIRIGRRYGIFGYEKRAPGVVDNVEEMAQATKHIAGDVANAVFAYGATKVKQSLLVQNGDFTERVYLVQALLPVRIGISLYLSPMFSRRIIEPIRKTIMQTFRRTP